MSLLPPPQAQWSLDNTAGGLLSLTRGFIQAATSDNVQPLALLACEQYGTTLPINTTTRIKVEKLARQNHSRPLSFLKFQVGFSAGDAADVLSRSDGGVRFLCLASILVSSINNELRSAELLELLIQDTAKQDQPLPTLMQLRDLLQALTPKLINSGLTNDVLGWYYWLGAKECHVASLMCPGWGEMRSFINALRRCFRLGEESSICVESCIDYIPFTVAIIKWILGKPPPVWRPDRSVWLESDLDGICINVSPVQGRFLVSIKHTVDSVEKLISVEGEQGGRFSSFNIMGGVVDTQMWTKIRLTELELDPVLCGPLLYSILKYLVPAVSLCRSMPGFMLRNQNSPIPFLLPEPIGDLKIRLHAAQCILGDNVHLPIEEADLATIEAIIKTECSDCPNCKGSGILEIEDPFNCFKDRIGEFAADVLALTLFVSGHGPPQFPQLRYPDFRSTRFRNPSEFEIRGLMGESPGWESLIIAGWWPLLTGELRVLSCTNYSVFRHVLALTGHREDWKNDKSAVVSAAYGQVIFPSILGEQAAYRSGYLRLKCIPGSLRWNNQSIHALVSKTKFTNQPRPNQPRPRHTQKLGSDYKPIQAAFEAEMPFHLSITDSRMEYLDICIKVPRDAADYIYNTETNPWDLIDGISHTIFSRACHHELDSPAGSLGEEFYLWIPNPGSGPVLDIFERGDEPLLLPNHESSVWQLLQLSVTGECCVLHRDGCLRCALDYAKKLGVKMVIC